MLNPSRQGHRQASTVVSPHTTLVEVFLCNIMNTLLVQRLSRLVTRDGGRGVSRTLW